jgi:glutamine amidotransferase-like uncharacterized protein
MEQRGRAPVLLYVGAGTSPNDVTAVKVVLARQRVEYSETDAAGLDAMSVADLRLHRMLLVPGGHYINMGKALRPETMATVRSAVEGGLNYLGICAGGLLAGQTAFNSFNLTGVRFGFYSVVRNGIHKAPVLISYPDGPALEHYWEDGPEFTGWGEVAGRYPDGTPAVVQGAVGKGWVVLAGVHAEAPENWRSGMTFSTPASADNAYAATLVDAALRATPLPRF